MLTMKDKVYLNPPQAADMLEVSPATVRRMFDDGQLTGFLTRGNYRRIALASVESVLAQREHAEQRRLALVARIMADEPTAPPPATEATP
jgi:predicted site-specific integrase-resolvase